MLLNYFFQGKSVVNSPLKINIIQFVFLGRIPKMTQASKPKPLKQKDPYDTNQQKKKSSLFKTKIKTYFIIIYIDLYTNKKRLNFQPQTYTYLHIEVKRSIMKNLKALTNNKNKNLKPQAL